MIIGNGNNEGAFGSPNPNEKPHWRDEPATEKQKQAIFNMANSIRVDYVEPRTKGEAADLIDMLSKKMSETKDFEDYPDDIFYPDDDRNL